MNDRPRDGGGPEDHIEDRPDGTPVTVRLASAGRGPGVLVGLIAVFVALALLKPWAFGGGLSLPTPRPTTAPAASPSADPVAALRVHCQEPDGWRIYSRERWASVAVRSWRSLDPAYGASGPLDASIPIVPLNAQIDALGYCSPWTADQRPPADAQVAGWSIVVGGRDPDGRTRGTTFAETIPLEPVDPSWPSVLGALYAPPVNRFDPVIGETVGWPAGRYVFAVRAPGYQRWWGIEVDPPPIDAPTPNLEPSGGPAASSRSASP